MTTFLRSTKGAIAFYTFVVLAGLAVAYALVQVANLDEQVTRSTTVLGEYSTAVDVLAEDVSALRVQVQREGATPVAPPPAEIVDDLPSIDDLVAELDGLNVGRPGIQGVPGPAGEDGLDGRNGLDGLDGAPGQDGAPGPPGSDGLDGEPGTDGADGTDGQDGAPGAAGQDGADGQDGTPGPTCAAGAEPVLWHYPGTANLGLPEGVYVICAAPPQ